MTLSLRRLAASLSIGSVLLLVGYSCLHASGGQQPLMQGSLVHLRAAKATLERAVPDKAGHRVKALALVNQAIDEVRAAIKAGR